MAEKPIRGRDHLLGTLGNRIKINFRCDRHFSIDDGYWFH